jgi:hypothetical protein
MGGKPSPEGPPQPPDGPILEPVPAPHSIWEWQGLINWPLPR